MTGIPGSGKTWLAKSLRAAGLKAVYDTDDILAEATRPGDTYNAAIRRGQSQIAEIVGRHAGLVVFVGTTLRPRDAARYHIKLGTEALRKAYRRTLQREIDKFTENRAALARAVKTVPAKTLPDYLMAKYGIGALDIMTTQAAYAKMARAALAHARKEKATIASQKKILAAILRLGKQN